MRNDSQRSGDGGALVPRPGRVNNGIIPNSLKTLSSYLRIVSSGASTMASTVRSAASAASAVVERDVDTNRDQVSWAGFDRLELERGIIRQVLLLVFSYGFQVWDVEVADNVCNLVSRRDGPVSFMQMLPKPLVSIQSVDKFSESRPLLIICADGSFSGGIDVQEGSGIPFDRSCQKCHGTVNGGYMPMVIWFYSLRSQSYVHLLRFRSVVHLVRCSHRVVAVLQTTQIHCLNAATLEREYTILTNPVPAGCHGAGDIGLGPLAVGPRWLAYSGSQVAASNSGRVIPQHLTSSCSFPCPASNGNLVAHYAKESSKQLATGIVTLGDMGYKKLSRYCSERLPDGKKVQSGTSWVKVHGIANGHSPDADSVGMVIVRDVVSKSVIAQIRAHKSPILSLCFDPSGILLVTASIQGHNINVFSIMPGLSGESGAASGSSYVHLYRLQRGLTNAVIQDISFSSDSQWIMISSTRGTSHLFSISPSGGLVNFQSDDAFFSARNGGASLMGKPAVHRSSNSGLQVLTQQSICASGPPVTLSAVSRIRNGGNGWINTVSGAAAAATGGRLSSLCGAIASAFHNCKVNDMYGDSSSLKKNYYLLVFSPSGSVIQYALHISPASSGMDPLPGVIVNCESNLNCDMGLMVEAIQKWNVCQKQNCKEYRDNIDMYGENGNTDSSKVHPERMKQENDTSSDFFGTTTMDKITTEEKHHMYISEAELQMHQNQNPLWSRPKMYFQCLVTDSFNINEACAGGGEIEIERVPTHALEARSKDLVPVFDYLQTPKFQPGRISVIDGNDNGQFQSHGSENGQVAWRSSSSSLDSIANGSIMENELDGGFGEKGQDGLREFTETSTGTVNTQDGLQQFTETCSGTVNINDTPVVSTRFETVNTREHSAGETQVTSVHNRDGLQMENQFAKNQEFD